MNTVTIPRRIAKNDDLIVVPRKKYEQLLRFWMNTERISRRDAKAVAKGLREIAQGKFLTSKEVRHELGL